MVKVFCGANPGPSSGCFWPGILSVSAPRSSPSVYNFCASSKPLCGLACCFPSEGPPLSSNCFTGGDGRAPRSRVLPRLCSLSSSGITAMSPSLQGVRYLSSSAEAFAIPSWKPPGYRPSPPVVLSSAYDDGEDCLGCTPITPGMELTDAGFKGW